MKATRYVQYIPVDFIDRKEKEAQISNIFQENIKKERSNRHLLRRLYGVHLLPTSTRQKGTVVRRSSTLCPTPASLKSNRNSPTQGKTLFRRTVPQQRLPPDTECRGPHCIYASRCREKSRRATFNGTPPPRVPVSIYLAVQRSEVSLHPLPEKVPDRLLVRSGLHP